MAGLGHGTTISFSGFSAEVTDLDISGVTREALDVSNLSTDTWMEFVPGGLVNPGTSNISFNFETGVIPPITSTTATTITITFPTDPGGNTGGTLVCDGFITDYSVTIDGTIRKATAVIKWTGEMTWTAET